MSFQAFRDLLSLTSPMQRLAPRPAPESPLETKFAWPQAPRAIEAYHCFANGYKVSAETEDLRALLAAFKKPFILLILSFKRKAAQLLA